MSETLAEARWRVSGLAAELEHAPRGGDDHDVICTHRPRCRNRSRVAIELRAARRELAAWFAPGEGQGVLW